MNVDQTFPALPESVAEARNVAAGALSDLPTDVVNDVVIMVSELATNAVIHARTPFRMTIDRSDDRVRVDVRDAGGGQAVRRSPPDSDLHGRGLQVVERLSDGWGTNISVAGDRSEKLVWFVRNLASGPSTSQRVARS
jgi:anti-sigma regulatory factor (Ser/Thr protein kinase)